MIPRRVHRIWLGPYRMPDLYVAHARQWEALGWPVIDWSWPELDKLPLSDETRAVLADIEANGANPGGGRPETAVWVQQADVLAYELVRCVGGVVVNCDIEPLQDLAPLLDGLDGFVVAEDSHFLCNAVMGAVPDHPLWVDLCDNLPARFTELRHAEMNVTTGPHYLTSRWKANGERVPRVGPVPFFPVSWAGEAEWVRPDEAQRDRSGFYVDHHWGSRHPELMVR